MARGREARAGRREGGERNGGRRGGMVVGLLIGLVVGLVVAAVVAWYFNSRSSEAYKSRENAVRVDPPPATKAETPPPPARVEKPVERAAPEPVVTPPPAKRPAPSPAKPAEPTTRPRVDLTFYDILPGEKPGKPATPPKLPGPPPGSDIWWLQVAALKNPADADRLRARLTLLGLKAVTQKVESGEQTLYRVRVGPYQREDDALGDLDILAENDFEPRLFKEPIKPAP